MVCPYCGQESSVYNSRPRERGQTIWRRRHCATCGANWTTIEQLVAESTYRVSKKGKVARFERALLFCSLYECLKHRLGAPKETEQLTDTVIMKLRDLKRPVIDIEDIKAVASATLKAYDPLAGQLYLTLHSISLVR